MWATLHVIKKYIRFVPDLKILKQQLRNKIYLAMALAMTVLHIPTFTHLFSFCISFRQIGIENNDGRKNVLNNGTLIIIVVSRHIEEFKQFSATVSKAADADVFPIHKVMRRS